MYMHPSRQQYMLEKMLKPIREKIHGRSDLEKNTNPQYFVVFESKFRSLNFAI